MNDDPMFQRTTPSLPYAGTAGFSGPGASRDMAEDEAADGTAAARQGNILQRLRAAGPVGATVAELRNEATGDHHGKTSSALTSMHKAGLIARLATTRNRCTVYVTPEHVEGRPTLRPGSNQPKSDAVVALAEARNEIDRLNAEIARLEAVPPPVVRPTLDADDAAWLDGVQAALVGRRPEDAALRTVTAQRLLDLLYKHTQN